MDASGCSGCSERDARIADLERRLAEAEGRLKTNASNSSIPPSANPLGADKPVKKKKSKRQRGGQPNHPPHLKQLLPSEKVTRIEVESRGGAVVGKKRSLWSPAQLVTSFRCRFANPVSTSRSSNRTCGFPASGSPTGFEDSAHGPRGRRVPSLNP